MSRDKRQNIRFKRQNKRNEWNRKKNADETLNIIEKILDYNKNAQKNFSLVSKIDKGKSELKLKKKNCRESKIKKTTIGYN